MFLKVDTREKNEEILDLLAERIEYELCSLSVGDYLWCNDDGGVICIEHKSVNDFRSSLMSGHLDTQIADIKQYPHCGLFISGDWRTVYDKRQHSFNRSMVKNKILSIGVKHGVPVYEFKYPTDFVDAIISIGDIVENGRAVNDVVRNTFTKNKLDANYQMYSAIDGMGRKKIEALMIDYPCIFDFFDDWNIGHSFPKSIVNKTTENFLKRLRDES